MNVTINRGARNDFPKNLKKDSTAVMMSLEPLSPPVCTVFIAGRNQSETAAFALHEATETESVERTASHQRFPQRKRHLGARWRYNCRRTRPNTRQPLWVGGGSDLRGQTRQ